MRVKLREIKEEFRRLVSKPEGGHEPGADWEVGGRLAPSAEYSPPLAERSSPKRHRTVT